MSLAMKTDMQASKCQLYAPWGPEMPPLGPEKGANSVQLSGCAMCSSSPTCPAMLAKRNFLGKLKKILRTPHLPLEQVHNRVKELQQFDAVVSLAPSTTAEVKEEHCDGPLPQDIPAAQYRKVQCGNLRLSTKIGDNVVRLKTGHVAVIKN